MNMSVLFVLTLLLVWSKVEQALLLQTPVRQSSELLRRTTSATAVVVDFSCRRTFYISTNGAALGNSLTSRAVKINDNTEDNVREEKNNEEEGGNDTVRVRIWNTLMAAAITNGGGESIMTVKELSKLLNEKPPDVKFHLLHVQKQAKTLANKSGEWRERRGIPTTVKMVKIQKKLLAGTNGKKRKEVHIQFTVK